MPLRTDRNVGRRRFLCACCAGTSVAWVPALACAAEQVVAAHLEPRHHKRFENEYLRVLETILEPGDPTLFHEHNFDYLSATVRGGELRNEVPGGARAALVRLETGSVRYNRFQGRRYVHRVTNTATETHVLVVVELLLPAPGGFDVADRGGAPAYAPVLDNDRLRAWRVRLEPGQSAPPVAQSAPGLRVVLSGDRLSESVQGGPEREGRLRPGGFEWQPPGAARALRNSGTAPVELVELELR